MYQGHSREQCNKHLYVNFVLIGRKKIVIAYLYDVSSETDVLQKKKGENYKPFTSYMETEGKATLVDGGGFSSRQKRSGHIMTCMIDAALALWEQQNESNISSRCTSMIYEGIDTILFFAVVQPPKWDRNRANNLISSKASLMPHCEIRIKKSKRNSFVVNEDSNTHT